MDQQAIDNAIIRRLPQLVPQPDSISWRQVMAADRAVGDFELMQMERDRAPYDVHPFAGASWVRLVRELITIGGAA
jgi:hypothetical protein